MIASEAVGNTEIADNKPEIEESILGEEGSENGQARQAHLQRELAAAESERPVPISSAARSSTTQASVQTQSAVAEHTNVAEHVGETAPAATAEELLQAPWRASWSHPLLRMMPAKPINAPAVEEAAPGGAPSSPLPERPAEQDADEPPLAGIGSRELLRRWLEADGSEIFPLEQELTARGFGRLSERFVSQLFSEDVEDRVALVDGVLTEPGVNARPWLVLLAEDANADVRLVAVTIMATSNDAALVEKAWQVSIRDRDPRVAGLAGRLREQRQSLPAR
jgi:hypothetical protein